MYSLKEIALLPVCAINTLKNAWDGAANFISMESVWEKDRDEDPDGSLDVYDKNGQFHFKKGDILDHRNPQAGDKGFGGAKGWRVVGTIPALAQPDTRKEPWHNDLRSDDYIIHVGNGILQQHFKRNIELHMRPARRPTTVAEFTRR